MKQNPDLARAKSRHWAISGVMWVVLVLLWDDAPGAFAYWVRTVSGVIGVACYAVAVYYAACDLMVSVRRVFRGGR